MLTRPTLASASLGLALLVSGCSGDTLGLTTSSIDPKLGPGAQASAKVDPVCVTLKSQIDQLRKDGVAANVEKASTGKGTTVSVKRASLAKMTELDKANAEFQAKCSTISPAAGQAAAAPAPAAPAAGAAAAASASKPANSTVASAAGKEPSAPAKQP